MLKERLKKLQREYGERKKRAKQPGLGAFIEIPDDGRTDQELKQEIDQLKEAIEEKEAQKLLPPEIVWSTVDLPSVIADIAAQQAEVTLMGEGSLEQIEHKATQLQRLNTDERSNWAKEVLDALHGDVVVARTRHRRAQANDGGPTCSSCFV